MNAQEHAVEIKQITALPNDAWLALRSALWPHTTREEHLREMAVLVAARGRYAQFVAYSRSGPPSGMVEVSIRHDFVNGTDTSPVAFVEGLFVAPEFRRSGVARELVRRAEDWAKTMGCAELASDVPLDNPLSQQVHEALGFEETERVVYYRMQLR